MAPGSGAKGDLAAGREQRVQVGEPQIFGLKASSPSPASREGGERQRSAHCELGQDSVGLHLSSEQKRGIRVGLHLH